MNQRGSEKWHRISDVAEAGGTALCSICGPGARVFYKPSRNRWICTVSSNASRGRISPDARRRQRLQARFQMSPEEYDALLQAQQSTCAICLEPCQSGRRLAVDHDHETGAIRGLLCNACNRGLGCYRDRPELLLRAIAYLETNLSTTNAA